MGLASAGLYISDGVIGMHLPSDLGKVFMTNEFIIGVGLYFILMMVIGYLASRRVKTLANYLTANRSLPFFLALPTIVATWFGAGSCMGVSGTVYKEGFCRPFSQKNKPNSCLERPHLRDCFMELTRDLPT